RCLAWRSPSGAKMHGPHRDGSRAVSNVWTGRAGDHLLVRARSAASDGDRDLSLRLAAGETTHRVRDLRERICPVYMRGDRAGFDEFGEPCEVDGAFLA